MARRVSVKGKGADIFFGDYPPPSVLGPDQPAAEEPTVADPADGNQTEALQESKNASKQASSRARKKASSSAAGAGEPLGAALDPLLSHLSERPTVTNSFRYTDRELSWLSDVIYQVSKRYHTRISKQDVARLGLAIVLSDYQERGDASLLAQLAERKRNNA